MKVAFILSGLPDGLQCLDKNRDRVARILNKYGWITRVDMPFHSQASLLAIIDEYKDMEIDDFIFFYTGHGDASSDEGILTLRLHDGTTIDINTLHREYFSNLNINRKAIILDACYSGNFKGRDFHPQTEYLCSSDFDEESYEDVSKDGVNQSYFSYYFCEALENLEGCVTLEAINEQYLKPNVDVQNSKYISIDSRMVIVDKVKNSLEPIKNKESIEIRKMKKSLEERKEEIEHHIISNDLSTATKLIVKFVADFSTSNSYRREALLHQSKFKSLQDELRKYGKSSDLDRELKQLINSLFEFIEIIEEENKIYSRT